MILLSQSMLLRENIDILLRQKGIYKEATTNKN